MQIENIINESLAGDSQTNALNFVAYLRNSGMKVEREIGGYWDDKFYYDVKYNEKFVCFILVYSPASSEDSTEPWVVWSDDSGSKWYENCPLELAENLKEIAWKNVGICGNTTENPCDGCPNIGGQEKTILGKIFKNTCGTVFCFNNPMGAELECLKSLVGIRKNDILNGEITEENRTIELRKLSPNDGAEIYNLLQEIPKNENGFMNNCNGCSYEEYSEWLIQSENMANGIGLEDWLVSQNVYWLYVDGNPVGMGKLRHRLNEKLREDGGHIGYAIAPAYRNRGYGKILLKLLIDETKKMGISRILITVQNDNIASIQVALNNGGIIEKSNDVRTYIWIDSGG